MKRNGNNQGTLEKKGKWYYVKYTDIDGKRKLANTHETDKRKAESYRARFVAERRLAHDIGDKQARLHHIQAQLQSEIKTEKSQLMDIRKVSIKDIFARLFETEDGQMISPKVSHKSRESYRRYCECFAIWCESKIKNCTLDLVTKDMAGEWLRGFVDAGKLDYHKRALTALRLVYRCYIKMGVVFENPFDGIEYIRHIPHVTKRQLDDSEMSRLMDALKDEPLDVRGLFVLAIETGQRYGDVCKMRWDYITAKTENGKQTMWLEYSPSKTKRHGIKVSIPLSRSAQDIIAEIKQSRSESDYIFPNMMKGYNNGDGAKQMRIILGVFEKAKINRKNAEGKTVVGMHSLRHGFVSRMANNGVPLTTVMSMVGHTREKMTEHYTHTSDEAKIKAINAMSNQDGGLVRIEISKGTMDLLDELRQGKAIDDYLRGLLEWRRRFKHGKAPKR